MIIFRHEWRTGKRNFLLWTLSISFFLALCIFVFPELESEMQDVTKAFAGMGSFSAAFGLDRLNMGTLTGYYAIECGNILSIGGAFFAALIGISALSKEEELHTAEFLFSHPKSRVNIVLEKLANIISQLVALNVFCFVISVLSILAIGESIPFNDIMLLHVAYFLVQLDISLICFGISAFLKHGGFGIGIGIASVLYFMNIIANITDKVEILKYLSPFGFAEGSDLIAEGSLDLKLVVFGITISIIFTAFGSFYFNQKDI